MSRRNLLRRSVSGVLAAMAAMVLSGCEWHGLNSLSLPGTDDYRLRPDEAGYDNLVLAGDWTDSGLNSGCIESAVLSGLQAANVILGHGRFHRIRGLYLP